MPHFGPLGIDDNGALDLGALVCAVLIMREAERKSSTAYGSISDQMVLLQNRGSPHKAAQYCKGSHLFSGPMKALV